MNRSLIGKAIFLRRLAGLRLGISSSSWAKIAKRYGLSEYQAKRRARDYAKVFLGCSRIRRWDIGVHWERHFGLRSWTLRQTKAGIEWSGRLVRTLLLMETA